MAGVKVSDYAEEREELKTALTKWGTGKTGFRFLKAFPLIPKFTALALLHLGQVGENYLRYFSLFCPRTEEGDGRSRGTSGRRMIEGKRSGQVQLRWMALEEWNRY